MAPDLGVLLPVRDASSFLSGALESLSAQTFTDWTCWALDDGYRDGSEDLLRAHARDAMPNGGRPTVPPATTPRA